MSTPIPTAVLLFSALFFSPGISRQATHRPCHEVALSTRPGWTVSGSWSDDGSILRIVDLFRQEVLQYSDEGEYLGVLAEAKESTFDLVLPVRRRPENLEGAFYGHEVGRDFIVFGDVLRRGSPPREETWRSGFFRVQADTSDKLQSFYEISPDNPMRLFYRLGLPLIASLGETGYIVLMEEQARLVQIRPGSAGLEPLRAFPPGLEHRPRLPAWKELRDYAGLMRAAENVSMPVALFGWEDYLYVVGRHFQEGRTRWSLTKIDPRADTVLWTAGIPLSSATHHVTVVPGPTHWAWIEIGVARGLFDQDVERILFLPSEWLRDFPHGELCGLLSQARSEDAANRRNPR
jgi:hypothetical protein